jgi:hypothetical protein
MVADLAPAVAPARPRGIFSMDLGRPFLNLTADYLLIGGALSLSVLAFLSAGTSQPFRLWIQANLWTIVLLSNSAHFAGSTARLYSKPGAFKDFPFLTMGLPLLTVVVLTLGIALSSVLGPHIQRLYLVWSPYHYCAQSYGLAVMYCYRSSPGWRDVDKRLIRVACFLPFLRLVLTPGNPVLEWLLPALAPASLQVARGVTYGLDALAFVLPVVLFLRHQRTDQERIPVISLLLLLTNAVWLIGIGYNDRFSVAVVTVFHGLQYLAILTIFHVRDRVRVPGNKRTAWQHGVFFYLVCLALGYLLFQAWPHAYVLLGFGYSESVLLVIAVINIHHFIVDAFIWRLRKDPNYAIVSQGAVI